MAFTYTAIDGKRVEQHVAAAFQAVKKEFDAKCAPVTLHIADGTRTYDEQKKLFLGKYVLAGAVDGRHVYDTRWWEGRLWYRVVGGGTVAAPGTSNHEEDGPNGPRSIDIYDSGKDPGVTRFGTVRNAIVHDLMIKHGFQNEGDLFDEAWHKTYRGSLTSPINTPPKPTPRPKPAQPVPSDMLKWKWTGIQKMLKGEGYYHGAIDNNPGPETKKAMRRFLNAKGYSRRANGWNLAIKPIFTVNDVKAIQQWLKDTKRYKGEIDGIPGTGTHGGWNTAESQNARAYAKVK